MMKDKGGRQPLLAAAIEYVAQNGIRDRSLREIAAGLGTSHRMLIYHFGSREGLLVEIIRAMEEQQRGLLAELRENDAPPVEVAREFWRRLAAPDLAPYERLFFEVYGRALQGDPGTAALLDEIVDTWTAPLTESLRHTGVPAEQAQPLARLGVAAFRGLLLDLLATGDRPAVDAAVEQFLTMYEALLVSRANPSGAAGR